MLPFNFHDHVKAGFLLAFMLFLCYNNARVNFVESPETLDIQGFLKIFGFYLTQADDLGRVVIPKEIRRTMRIREGTPLEIYTSVDGEVIFRKYSPVGEISGTADQYADVLYKVGGMPTVICDRDHVIAASGIQKKEVLERRVSSSLEDLIEQRKSLYRTADGVKMNPIEGVDRFAVACAPIMADGDVNGAVIMLSDKENSAVDEKTKALVEAAAMYFGKQMEDV